MSSVVRELAWRKSDCTVFTSVLMFTKKGRQRVPKVVKAKSLAFLQLHSRFDGCWPQITLRQHASRPWLLTLQLCAREDPITVVSISRRLLPAEHELSQNRRQWDRSLRSLALGFANSAANPSATDFDSVSLERNVRPLQPKCLTDPQPSSHLAIPASLGCKWRIDLGQCRASRDCRYCPALSGNVYHRPADTMNTGRSANRIAGIRLSCLIFAFVQGRNNLHAFHESVAR